MDLDEDDLKILNMLQEDGRISYVTIGKRLNIPTSTVHDKIRRFISEGIIKNFVAMLDERAVGFNSTSIVGVETDAKYYSSVANTLKNFPEVVEIFGTTAEFDLMIKIQAKNREELTAILTRIRSIDGIDDIYIYSVLEVFKDKPLRSLI